MGKRGISPGDLIGVAAPGFAVRREPLEAGVKRLQELGYQVRLGRHVLSRHGYFAGTDAQRAADLNDLFQDPRVRAVWFARGGYGTARLLDSIDWRALRKEPKLLVGYSDVTALFSPFLRKRGPVCLYGPVVSELGDQEAYHLPSLRKLLRGEGLSLRFAARQVLCPGRAEGPIAGGNLTVLAHLMGTRYAPDLAGSLLLLEDVGEEVYRLDRMFNHLKMSGALKAVAGVLLGGFFAPKAKRSYPPDRPLTEVFREYFEPLGVPVVMGLPVGHLPGKRTLPLGSVSRLDTRVGRIDVAGPAGGNRGPAS